MKECKRFEKMLKTCLYRFCSNILKMAHYNQMSSNQAPMTMIVSTIAYQDCTTPELLSDIANDVLPIMDYLGMPPS